MEEGGGGSIAGYVIEERNKVARLAGCFKARLLVSQESPGQKREKWETGGPGVHVVVAFIGGIMFRVHWGRKGGLVKFWNLPIRNAKVRA